MIQIFPYIFTRQSSGSVKDMYPLCLTDAQAYISDYNTLTTQKKEWKTIFNQCLFDKINHLSEEPQKQNELLTLKRAIYNDRPLSEHLQATAKVVLGQDWTQYNQISEQLHTLTQTFEHYFQHQVQTHREIVKRLLSNEWLQKGLRLSSKTLFTQQHRYLKTPTNQLRAKEYQIETGLLRYMTRLYYKTSPFSTFTYVGLATTAPTPGCIYFPPSPPSIQSSIRLNNYILDHLKTLLTQHPDLNNWFKVGLNSSVQSTKTYQTFLVNFNNVEVFQKLPTTELLTAVAQVIASEGEEMYLHSLISVLCQDYVEGTYEEVKSYMQRLLEVGFLEFRLGVSGIHPEWDKVLVHQLTHYPVQHPLIHQTIDAFAQLRKYTEDYAQSSVSTRNQLLETAYHTYETLRSHLLAGIGIVSEVLQTDKSYHDSFMQHYQNETEFTIRPYYQSGFTSENLLYEDAYSLFPGQIDTNALQAYVSVLDTWCKHLYPMESEHDERDKMSYYFCTQYGTGAQVDILDFYQSYNQHVRKPEKEKAASHVSALAAHTDLQESDPFLPPTIRRRMDYRQQWHTTFVSILSATMTDTDCVHITEEQLHQVVTSCPLLPEKMPEESYSLGAFVQLYTTPSGSATPLQGVVNSIFTGMGRSCGRFLHLFETHVTECLQTWNTDLYPDVLLAELSDASYFNANIHPPLLPYEISIPGGHTNLQESQQIPIRDIAVAYDTHTQQVYLYHKPTQKRIRPFDLCLQAPTSRSELYQMLSYFGQSRECSVHRMIDVVYHAYRLTVPSKANPTEGIWVYPRICIEKQVIIQRQAWYIRKDHIPKQESSETDAQYFIRLTQWRHTLQIPEEVFIHINPLYQSADGGKPSNDENKKMNKDDYKPQYIHFGMPLLVRFFEKQLEKIPSLLKIEEMLPSTDKQPTQVTDRVNEYLIQWYSYPHTNRNLSL